MSHSRSRSRSRSRSPGPRGRDERSKSDKDEGKPIAPTRILYVRDIPRDLDIKIMKELFEKFTGFLDIRRLPLFAFVEFDNVEHASSCLKEIQGHKFRSGDRPIVVDYDKDARDPLGKNVNPNVSRKRKADSPEGNRSPRRPRSRSPDYRREDRRDRGRSGDGRPDPASLLSASFMRHVPHSNAPPLPPTGKDIGQAAPTLFVSSLPGDVTERELSILFRFVPGFVNLRLIKKENRARAFVDFADTHYATFALTMFQGYKLDRDSMGIAIEYDKTYVQKGRERDTRRDLRDSRDGNRFPPSSNELIWKRERDDRDDRNRDDRDRRDRDERSEDRDRRKRDD